jgi:hypothetical protein
MTIERTKDRVKQTGEVFTPLSLVDEILSKLPIDTWGKDKTFIDPACGDGNFLIRVIAWKMWNGATAKQALQTTYGVDLMNDNVTHCQQRLLTTAFVCQQHYKTSTELFPHLSPEDEREFGMARDHGSFARKHDAIVKKNIVCHNALTYDYSFGDIEANIEASSARTPKEEEKNKRESDFMLFGDLTC